jgi:hypothetical protein
LARPITFFSSASKSLAVEAPLLVAAVLDDAVDAPAPLAADVNLVAEAA